jgi:hypothetical protein
LYKADIKANFQIVMNHNALKWKLIAWLGCTLAGAATGLVSIGLNYLLELVMGFKKVSGENCIIFMGFLLFGVISGFVGAVRMRPKFGD